MKKNDYVDCNRKDIESSCNNVANCNISSKNDIENTNSKNMEFCIANVIANKADINEVMDKKPSKKVKDISQEKLVTSVNISRKNMNSIKIGFVTGISDFYNLVVTVFRSYY